ncbi:immunoglobulin-like domain-containing protein [Archangium lansingense]|uniref:Bacterial Ig-like domain-containing protein n=1 Tax=Archangium lansingense TaxID=2995310 RepID=A0ABT3ZWV9_9BACT|nr:hypothetical protein [Archangium lansinium]MCY1073860.1 hypothetical protein [Archangium lansinium]
MSRWNMLLGGAVLWLSACGAPLEGQAVLRTDQEHYAPGSELKLQLQNVSLQSLGYNLCFATLQRQAEETWTEVPRPDGTVCAAYQDRLLPGKSSEELQPLDASLPEGTYRYVISVEWDDEREAVVSNSFSVAHVN